MECTIEQSRVTVTMRMDRERIDWVELRLERCEMRFLVAIEARRLSGGMTKELMLNIFRFGMILFLNA